MATTHGENAARMRGEARLRRRGSSHTLVLTPVWTEGRRNGIAVQVCN